MAELTIQFLPNPQRRQRFFRITLRSDEDTTPREHEQDNRRLVQALFPELHLEEPGERITVEREAPAREPCLGCSGGNDDYQVIDLD